MKNFIMFVCLMLAFGGQVSAQCGITGPGAGGTVTTCDQGPVTYNYAGCCNTPGLWHVSIDGIIDLDQNTPLPFNFTTFAVSGTVVAANHNGITIQWDCSGIDCCDGNVQVRLYPCGFDGGANPVIRLTCTPDFEACGGTIYDPGCGINDVTSCITTPCECLRACINGVEVILTNNSQGTAQFCYPYGTEIGQVVACDVGILCENDPGTEATGGNIKIPEANITAGGGSTEGMTLSIKLPDENFPYTMIVADSSGKVVAEQLINEKNASIDLANLSFGIYFVSISNGTTTLSHKFVFSN